MDKKPLDVCKNCGDKFRMPVHAVPGRAHRGWCAGCWSQYDKARSYDARGNEYWNPSHPGGGARRGYASRPDYNEEA